MSHSRFNHVFLALMVLSAVSAFGLPSRLAGKTPQVAALFAPVARPAGALGAWMQQRVAPDTVRDQRSSEAIRLENTELKSTVQNLTARLDELSERDVERGKLGPLRDLCTPWSVVGADSGTRESLALRGTSLEGLREGMYVLYAGGVAGQIERIGIAGSQVRLISDLGFRVRGTFGTFRRRDDNTIEFAKLEAPAGLVEGIGRNVMVIRNLTFDAVTSGKLAAGDWVTLSDGDWPPNLQGQPLGRISEIVPRAGAPLFAEIRIKPQSNLSKLREVMIVTKEK